MIANQLEITEQNCYLFVKVYFHRWLGCYVAEFVFVFVLLGTGPVGGYQQMPQQPPQPQRIYPSAPSSSDADEMRRRRLQRFANNS